MYKGLIMPEPYRVLFLCKHNAGRSLMAEAILNQLGARQFLAYSAGIEPSSHAHPYTISILTEAGYNTTNLYPKSIQQFMQSNAPKIDLVIGLCNTLPENSQINRFFSATIYWDLSNIDSVSADSKLEKSYFYQIQHQLNQRLKVFANIFNATLSH